MVRQSAARTRAGFCLCYVIVVSRVVKSERVDDAIHVR